MTLKSRAEIGQGEQDREHAESGCDRGEPACVRERQHQQGHEERGGDEEERDDQDVRPAADVRQQSGAGRPRDESAEQQAERRGTLSAR